MKNIDLMWGGSFYLIYLSWIGFFLFFFGGGGVLWDLLDLILIKVFFSYLVYRKNFKFLRKREVFCCF